MDNPFADIMNELAEIKQLLSVIRTSPEPAIEIIDRKELLKRLNITEPTAIRWGKRGTIPEIHIGSNVRYNWHSVVRALEDKEQPLSQPEHNRFWKAKNREKIREQKRFEVHALGDSYVKGLLQSQTDAKVTHIPQEVIEAKRNVLKIKRTIKNGIYGDNTPTNL